MRPSKPHGFVTPFVVANGVDSRDELAERLGVPVSPSLQALWVACDRYAELTAVVASRASSVVAPLTVVNLKVFPLSVLTPSSPSHSCCSYWSVSICLLSQTQRPCTCCGDLRHRGGGCAPVDWRFGTRFTRRPQRSDRSQNFAPLERPRLQLRWPLPHSKNGTFVLRP